MRSMSGKDDIPSGFDDLEEVEAPFEFRNIVIKHPPDTVDKHYNAHEELGSGKFGRVVRCTELTSGRTLACKYIDLKMSKVTDILNEIDIMKKLQHPRLLQLYDAFQEESRMILILEFLTGGELFYRVVNTEYSERTCKFYLIQLCEAVNFMHEHKIVHLDLKPENILLVNPNSNKIKVIDFGLAREQKPGESLKVLWGTAEFVAPEVINYEEISTKTDMWSIGVITYILLSGISPFMGENISETYGNVVNVRYDFDDESFETCSPEAKVFIQDLLVKEQSKRMGADVALKHNWLQEITANTKFDKSKLKNYLLRRKWRRAINGVIALQLMGADLQLKQ